MKEHNIFAKRICVLAAACAAAIAMRAGAAHAQAGSPDHQVVSGVWTVTSTTPRTVDGTLSFADGARVAIANESPFAAAGEGGVEIAFATCGIEGSPSTTNYNFRLRQSGRIDLRGGPYTATNLVGEPDVINAAPFRLSGDWTIEELLPLTVDGTLNFTGGSRVVAADESLLASVGTEGVVIATATGGIFGTPDSGNYGFGTKLSADGKSLILYYALPTVADWTKFSRKMTVAFGGVQSGVTLSDFPVLVKLSTAISGFSYADFRWTGGKDLRFADSNGNLIPHEIDTWNPNGVSTVWVKVPTLSSSTTITAYYGCKLPVRAMDASKVWSNGYMGVWHLGAPAGATVQPDSTTNRFNFSDHPSASYAGGMINDVDGIVGKAVSGGGRSDGMGQYQYNDSAGRLDGFKAITVEAWTCQNDHDPGGASDIGMIVKKYNGSQTIAFNLVEQKVGVHTFTFYINGTNNLIWTTPKPARAQWHHTAAVWDGSVGYRNEYLNGTPLISSPNGSEYVGELDSVRGYLVLGNSWAGGTQQFKGSIDEVRISKVARSEAWVKATHDTVTDPNFATYNAVEVMEQPTSLVFAKEVNVTFSGYSGAALANFPVLVRLSQSIPGFRYADFNQSQGGDLRFFDAGGNLLAHEIDTWNPNGVSTVWVKVPTLDASTTITAKYGCEGTPPEVWEKDVWDDGYLGVWHLGAASGRSVQPDSTWNVRDFAINANYSDGVASGADGIVGRSASTGLRSDGKGCFSHSDAKQFFAGRSAFTVETWTWQDDHEPAQNSTLRYVLAHSGQTEESYDWRIYENNKGKLVMQFSSLGSLDGNAAKIFADDSATRPARAQWNHTAFAWNGSNGQLGLYLGGNQLALASTVTTNNWKGKMAGSKTGFNLGNHRYDNDKPFKGRIDEVRISKVARSAAWIKATHDTIANANFATYAVPGAEPQVAFAKEVNVAFTGYSGGAALANFPVLVRLSENIPGFSYADFQIENGGDLRFFDADGRLLPHEIDTWNTNGVSSVWVKVPSLTASTAITAKYGCEAPPDNDPGSVWSNGYVGVWHLGESDLPLRESSEKSSGFSSKSGSTIAFAAPGVVGGSVDFSGVDNNSVVAADHDALDGFSKFTIELWTYQTEWKKNAGVLNKKVSDTSELAYSLFETLTSSGTWTMPIKVGTSRTAGTDWSYHQPPATNRWSHTAFTVDMTITNNNIHGFKNGNLNSWVQPRNYSGLMPNCASDLCLGNSVKGASNGFPGKIDEVRISNVIRSADWIKATYDTIMSPGFATYSTAVGTLSGYGAWMNAKELVGAPAEAAANGIENGVRYAFDIAPEKGPDSIGTPIIRVVRDAAGNPSVQSRDLATGRDDVTFGILATPDLLDWSNATLVPMKKFPTDGLWKPTASESAGYVFPSQMFFKYTIEIQ